MPLRSMSGVEILWDNLQWRHDILDLLACRQPGYVEVHGVQNQGEGLSSAAHVAQQVVGVHAN
jgi:hypothetical protein